MPTSHPYRTRRTNPITTSHQTQYQAFQSIQSATRTLFSNMNDNDTNPRTDNTDDSDVDLFPSFDAHVTDILRNFLNLATEENDIICEALCHAGCTTWAEFRFFSPVLIPCLEYEKRGQLVPIYPSHVLRLNALAAYMAHLNDTLGPNSSLDFSHYDSNAFASFRVTHLSAIASSSSTSSTMQNAPTNHTSWSSPTKSDAQVKYELWSKRTNFDAFSDGILFPIISPSPAPPTPPEPITSPLTPSLPVTQPPAPSAPASSIPTSPTPTASAKPHTHRPCVLPSFGSPSMPSFGAHFSPPYTLTCTLTKRHCDSILLQLYHLFGTHSCVVALFYPSVTWTTSISSSWQQPFTCSTC
mmetsp:Transcript_22311/g.62107  ORF Transcript_22311/g.62107 Transcript_22311/m.62107 type:complete len:355 (-) Transcript_22311:608-1672(-)